MMANLGILNVHIFRIIVGIGILAVSCKSEKNDCFPLTTGAYITCNMTIPVFDKNNSINTLNYKNCKAGLLSNGTFKNLGRLKTLSISCEFSNDTRLELELGIFDFVKGNLTRLELRRNNIRSLHDRIFCELANVISIDLSSNALTEINNVGFGSNCGEKSPMMNLTWLAIQDNAIKIFPNGTFRRLPQLRALKASNNSLQEIEPAAFEGMIALSTLDLSSNRLTFFPPHVIQTLSKLSDLNLSRNLLTSNGLANVIYPESLGILNLSNNRMTTIEAAMFKNLRKLTRLHLSYNQFRVIESGFASMLSLITLDLNNAKIEEIKPEAFRGLTALATLDLSDNKIEEIKPEAFRGLSALATLDLSDNKLRKLEPGTFANVSNRPGEKISGDNFQTMSNATTWNLQTLRLARNVIRDLNAFASFSLRKLEELDLSENSIEIISTPTFHNATSLSSLNLSHNKIRAIESRAFDNLTYHWRKGCNLNLDYNELTNIDGKLFHATKLTSISLNHNQLKNFSYSSIPIHLNRLSLSHNQISNVIKENAYYYFEDMELEYMDLSYNRIKQVSYGDFPQWMVDLALHNNLIQHIEENLLNSLNKIQNLTLHNNNLQTLCPQEQLKYIKTPMLTITLSGNPFICSCEIEWLKYKHTDINSRFSYIKDLQSVNCRSMTPRHGTQFQNINQVAKDAMFLCKSTNEHSNSCNCTSSNSFHCEMPCPKKCSCYRNGVFDFVLVDCSESNLTIVPAIALREVPTLYLFVDGNNINSINGSFFQLYPNITKLFLNNSQLETIEGNAFQKLTSLELLQLDHNKLEMLPDAIFAGLSNLKELYLAHNKLTQLQDEIFSPLKSLLILHLNNNSLVKFPVWELSKLQLLVNVGLQQNKWSCDCTYIDQFRTWLQKYVTIVHDADNLACSDQPTGQEMPLISFSFDECYNVTPLQFLARWAPAWGSALGVILLIFLTIAFAFIYRREMQVLIYSRYGVRIFSKTADETDQNKSYDAFIAYSCLDEDFLINVLLPGLEEIENPFKLCLHHRHFLAGAFITDSILEAVEKSRRTIMLLSENFVNSEWCRFEFKAAHIQMMKDRSNRVIIVVLGDVPKEVDSEIKLYLTTNTFLKWGDNLFWEKLYFALPDKNN